MKHAGSLKNFPAINCKTMLPVLLIRDYVRQSTASALAAPQIATWTVVTLALFAILIDVYLFLLTRG
jgi:hypothetical protein